jgi:hypothetical protein
VADDEPVARTAVPTVGNERDVGETRAHDCSAGFELLGHAWATLGAFVADYDDDVFAVGDEACVEGGVELVFFVEDLCGYELIREK